MHVFNTLMQIPGLGSLAGIGVLISLIWMIGPLLSLGGYSPLANPRNQWLITGVLVLGWLFYLLVSWLWRRRKNSKMARQMAGEEADSAEARSSAELKAVRKTFDNALTDLRKTRLGKRGQYLYQLPWYVIIGPPGSGKTTALLNSGLNFPLAKRRGIKKLRGVGGTRNCDWFISDEAVLIDTAGRFVSQDSDPEVDRQVWQGFLKLLQRFRRRSPINGVLVTISLQDLMALDEAERTAAAEAIKQRIQELHGTLKIRFPVYVLFTKSDLVAGFVEFFDDLRKEERAQVWGVTFPFAESLEPEDPPWDGFNDAFEALEARLYPRMLERLQAERALPARDRIYTYPQQLRSLKEIAETFLNEVFQPDPHEQPAMLRGVYFTSGTQEGNPIDRMIQRFARTLGLETRPLPRFSGEGRSFFLTRLLQDVVIPEAGLSGNNRRVERRQRLLRWAGYVGMAVLTVVLLGAWWGSYRGNDELVVAVNEQARAAEQQAAAVNADELNLAAVVPALNRARGLPGATDDDYRSPGLTLRYGLYQGDKLGDAAGVGYQRLLTSGLLPRLMIYLRDSLTTALGQNGDLLDAYIPYRMLEQPACLDRELMMSRLQALLGADSGIGETDRTALLTHLYSLLARPLPEPLSETVAIDGALLQRARQQLDESLLRQNPVLETLENNVQCRNPSVGSLLGPGGATLFTRRSGQSMDQPLHCAYTREGFAEVVASGIGAAVERTRRLACLLDDPGLAADPAAVRGVYIARYRERWHEIVEDLQLVCAPDSDAITTMGQQLAGAGSPIRALFRAVADNTAVDPAIGQGFGDIQTLLEGDPPPLDGLLDELRARLALPAADTPRQAQLARGQTLVNYGNTLPQPQLRQWVVALGQEQQALARALSQWAELANAWQAGPLSACLAATDGRPFVPSADHTVAEADFTRAFGPGGEITRLFQRFRLSAFCKQGVSPPIRPDALAQFCRADAIRQAFFPGNRARPAHGLQQPPDALRLELQRFRCPRCL